MKQFLLILFVYCISLPACSVASLQQSDKQEQLSNVQNTQQKQIVPQESGTPPEDEQKNIYEIPEGVKRRIEFGRGRKSATVTGRIVRMSYDQYLVKAQSGQRMAVIIESVEDNAVFDVYSDDEKSLTGDGDDKKWSGQLPIIGDYIIYVGSSRGNANYKMQVTIR